MIHELTRERLTGWVDDFAAGDGLAAFPPAVAESAPSILLAWLVAACEQRDVEPEDVEPDDLRRALLGTVARLDVGAGVHDHVPALCRDLLAELEAAGRWHEGRATGLALAALRPAYERAVRNEPEPLARPGTKLGRNDPCPCGSGKKYKRCCMNG